MGLLHKLVGRRIRRRKNNDMSLVKSYDMTELASSDEDDDFQSDNGSLPSTLQNAPPLSRSSARKRRNLPTTPAATSRVPKSSRTNPPDTIDTSNSMNSMPEMSDRAKQILYDSFPASIFEGFEAADKLNEDDLEKYPDPELSLVMLDSSSEDSNSPDRKLSRLKNSQNTTSTTPDAFKGLMIDTSIATTRAPQTDDDDEFLIASPKEAMMVSNTMSSTAAIAAATKSLAHVFLGELSTLYEDDKEEEELSDPEVNPKSKVTPDQISLRDRWDHILQLTVMGHCDPTSISAAILEEGEI